jgi:TIR domain
MIFVSYSHADGKWRKRFETISKPLSRVMPMQFWSDKQLKAGEWEKQIQAAMANAEAVVFLVSPAFLASDYIISKEVPYFLKAYEQRNVMIFWALLEPCDLSHYPGSRIKAFQAMTRDGNLKALSSMTDWQWQETMVKGCEMIDNDFVKPIEQPMLDSSVLKKPSLPRVSKGFVLLKKPARRDVEVLVYSGKWWRQDLIKMGTQKTNLYLGDDRTKRGEEFIILALTTDQPLKDKTYSNLPRYRTKTDEVVVRRA